MKFQLYALLTTLVLASAHIALWDEAMYGFDPDDVNQSEPVNPLRDLPLTSWFFHGHKHNPPAPGKFMSLPAGGVYHGEVSCNKAFTRYGVLERQQKEIYACPKPEPKIIKTTTGAMHTVDKWDTPVEDLHDVTGCAIAIAYESDADKVKPEDFVVISTNYTCPWFKEVDFEIPPDLPACPEEGCTCMWGWIPSGNGGIKEMYSLNYRCKVEGAKGTKPLPKPKAPTKCDYPTDKTNCTVGAKQPIYWLQLDNNNVDFNSTCSPFYNGTYGYMDGAQTDLFAGIEDTDTKDIDHTYRLSGLGIASQPPSSSPSSSASDPAHTPHSAAKGASGAEHKGKGKGKGKSGKVCKRGRRGERKRSPHADGVMQQMQRSQTRSEAAEGSRSMVRRMDVVAGQARMVGAVRRRDSTAV